MLISIEGYQIYLSFSVFICCCFCFFGISCCNIEISTEISQPSSRKEKWKKKDDIWDYLVLFFDINKYVRFVFFSSSSSLRSVLFFVVVMFKITLIKDQILKLSLSLYFWTKLISNQFALLSFFWEQTLSSALWNQKKNSRIYQL